MNWTDLIDCLSLTDVGAQSEFQVSAVGGGDINQAFRLVVGEHCLFVKLNQADRLSMFEAEREGLETIAATQTIRVPEVIATGHLQDRAGQGTLRAGTCYAPCLN